MTYENHNNGYYPVKFRLQWEYASLSIQWNLHTWDPVCPGVWSFLLEVISIERIATRVLWGCPLFGG